MIEDTHALVVGFPHFSAREVIRQLGEQGTHVMIFVPYGSQSNATDFLHELPDGKFTIIEGDLEGIDLGLSGEELAGLTQTITSIHNLLSIRSPSERSNLGLRKLIDFAYRCKKLRRFIHWSSYDLFWGQKGYFHEDDRISPRSALAAPAKQFAVAEQLCATAVHKIPIMIMRVAALLDHRSVECIAELRGPNVFLADLLAPSSTLKKSNLLIPSAPIYLIPIEQATSDILYLATHAGVTGTHFHLCSPRIFSMGELQALRPKGERRSRPALLKRLSGRVNRIPRIDSRATRRVLQAAPPSNVSLEEILEKLQQ